MIAQFNGFEISPVHLGDAWKICDFCVTNTERLKRYFPETLEQNLNPTLSHLFVEKKVKQFENKDEFLFTIKQSKSRKLVGLVYLKELNWEIEQGEFAYCIDYTYKGKEIISQAIQFLADYAFVELGLKTLQIITHKDNLPSVKVALNNNFKWRKTLLKEFTPRGENPLDMELYELDDER